MARWGLALGLAIALGNLGAGPGLAASAYSDHAGWIDGAMAMAKPKPAAPAPAAVAPRAEARPSVTYVVSRGRTVARPAVAYRRVKFGDRWVNWPVETTRYVRTAPTVRRVVRRAPTAARPSTWRPAAARTQPVSDSAWVLGAPGYRNTPGYQTYYYQAPQDSLVPSRPVPAAVRPNGEQVFYYRPGSAPAARPQPRPTRAPARPNAAPTAADYDDGIPTTVIVQPATERGLRLPEYTPPPAPPAGNANLPGGAPGLPPAVPGAPAAPAVPGAPAAPGVAPAAPAPAPSPAGLQPLVPLPPGQLTRPNN